MKYGEKYRKNISFNVEIKKMLAKRAYPQFHPDVGANGNGTFSAYCVSEYSFEKYASRLITFLEIYFNCL